MIKPIATNITKITAFPVPNTKRKLKKFIGLCGFYRHLVPNFAKLTSTLNDLTTPKAKFEWTIVHQQAFDDLQKIFFKPPFLRQPDWSKQFYLNTDASSSSIAACLMQEFNGELLPISYFSKTLNKHEKNYPPIKLELMAIVKGIEAFRYYLYSREFIVLSDSAPLKHYKRISSPTDLTTRWLIAVSEYQFKFQHIPGQQNILADYFSRLSEGPPKQDIVSHPEILSTKEVLPIEEINLAQLQNTDISSGSKTVGCEEKNNTIPNQLKINDNCSVSAKVNQIRSQYSNVNKYMPHSANVDNFMPHFSDSSKCMPHSQNVVNCTQNKKNYDQQINQLSHTDTDLRCKDRNEDPLLEISDATFFKEQVADKKLGEIYKLVKNGKHNKLTEGYVISDNNLLYKQVKVNHNNYNSSSMLRLVVPRVLIPKVLRILHVGHSGIVKTYQFLQERFFWQGAYKDLKDFVNSCNVCLVAKPQRIPPAPFQGTFLPSHPGEMISIDLVGPFRNNMYLLTVIDIFSRHLELYPLSNITAKSVSDKIIKYISSYGRPAQILCDQGRQFTSHIFQTINNILQINLIYTSVARPQANGISERINSSIKATIKALQIEGHSFLHAVDLHKSIYNASKHPSTGFTPNLIHFARDLSLFTDTIDFARFPPYTNLSFNLFQIFQAIDSVYQMVYNNLQTAQKFNQVHQRKFNTLRQFKKGDAVYIKGTAHFQKKIDGPFQVLQQRGPVNYLVQRCGNVCSRKFVIHADRLVRARPRPDRLADNHVTDSNAGVSHKHTNSVSFQEQISSDLSSSADPGIQVINSNDEHLRSSQNDISDEIRNALDTNFGVFSTPLGLDVSSFPATVETDQIDATDNLVTIVESSSSPICDAAVVSSDSLETESLTTDLVVDENVCQTSTETGSRYNLRPRTKSKL